MSAELPAIYLCVSMLVQVSYEPGNTCHVSLMYLVSSGLSCARKRALKDLSYVPMYLFSFRAPCAQKDLPHHYVSVVFRGAHAPTNLSYVDKYS